MYYRKKQISNWNNYPRETCAVATPSFYSEIQSGIRSEKSIIARGNGRCYGDASLNSKVLSTLGLNKILSLDSENAIIECQSGVILADLLEILVPRKLFLPVTPGTKYISVGGAIASDVHGKNHHKEGSFSNFLISFDLMLEDGSVVSCTREKNEELFWESCGGMGLTGIILKAKFRLKRIETSYIREERIKTSNLDEVMQLFEESMDWTYVVAWIDCLKKGKAHGRSILARGEHAAIDELIPRQRKDPLTLNKKKKIRILFYFPSFILSTPFIKLFNAIIYNMHRKRSKAITHYDPFFYPLDRVIEWNRMYGKNGFVQYQFVLPLGAEKALYEIINRIADSGSASFLTVLKQFGKGNPKSTLTFPIEGYTLALDFKISTKVFELLEQLDKIVVQNKGRIYLSKDARMDASTFKEIYGEEIFRKSIFESKLSKRLNIWEE